MEFGEFTFANIILMIVGVLLGGGIAFSVIKVSKSKNKNNLTDNDAEGDIIGGSKVASNEASIHIEKNNNQNILSSNKAGGDIVGGNKN